MRVRTACWSVLALALLGAASARAGDPIFDQSVLHDVHIVMDPNDWTSLQRDFLSNQYYAANVSIDGEVVQQVGVRSRGKGSRSGVKPSFLVNTDKYVANQRFHGLKKVILNNATQDNTFLKPPLSFAVFEAMGIASPQVSYARVTVNDQYWGVYWLTESIDKDFLSARFGENGGNLYKYEALEDYRFQDKGSDPKGYFPLFKPESPDNPDGTALVEFVQTANTAPETGFAAALSPYIDVDRFLTYIAVENALAEQDGFLGFEGMNNFYLYQLAGQKKFVLIPWDKDNTFIAADWPALIRVDTNVLSRKIMADPARQQFYLSTIKATADRVLNPTVLMPKLEAYYALIRNSVLTDTKKPNTNDEFELGVQGMRGLVTGRPISIKAAIP